MLVFKHNDKPHNTKPSYKSFIFLLFLTISFMFFNNTKFFYFIKNSIGFVVLPSQDRLSQLLKENQYKISSFYSLFYTYNDNELLRYKLSNYNELQYRISFLKKENEELRNVLELSNSIDNKLINTKVIGRTIDDWYDAIIIGGGKNKGIQKGSIVISYNKIQPILVGQVIEVYTNYSKVLLLTSLSSNIHSFIPNRNIYTFVSGNNKKFLKVSSIQKVGELQNGDFVFTSGFGGVFPSGLYIGKIKIFKTQGNIYENIFVIPDNKIYSLFYVSVINLNK